MLADVRALVVPQLYAPYGSFSMACLGSGCA
jgi:hypothetical protein